jgi:hypothetical protein
VFILKELNGVSTGVLNIKIVLRICMDIGLTGGLEKC